MSIKKTLFTLYLVCIFAAKEGWQEGWQKRWEEGRQEGRQEGGHQKGEVEWSDWATEGLRLLRP